MSFTPAYTDTSRSDHPYLTYAFQRQWQPPPPAKPDAKAGLNQANIAGFYYEAMVLKYFCELTGSDLPNFTGSQKNAIHNFESIPDNDLKKEVLNLKNSVDKGARITASALHNEVLKTAEKTNVVVDNIAVEEDSVAGNLLGDIQILIDGREITLELKWQNSPSRPTRWFSDLSDATLFNNKFSEHIQNNAVRFWSNKMKEGFWKKALHQEALPEFLNNFTANPAPLIRYLIQKGQPLSAPEVKTKLVAHASFTGVTITGLDTIEEALEGSAMKKGPKMIPRRAIVFEDSNGDVVASFGLSNFRNEARVKRARERVAEGKAAQLTAASTFAFQLYIDQKYFSSHAAAQNWNI